MSTYHGLFVLGLLLLLAADRDIRADDTGDPLELSIEVTVNPAERS